MPVPVLVSATAPLPEPFSITPSNAPEPLEMPTVSVTAPSEELVTFRLSESVAPLGAAPPLGYPVRMLIVWLMPARSTVPTSSSPVVLTVVLPAVLPIIKDVLRTSASGAVSFTRQSL
ncbi:MAG: hypothetical protein BWX70_02331 [Verrucomicrobia bacterium ADurb.Bin070]|nr:MAG: hypothetical protein BWX70_02331 [Verrucomicrobia bacterium ADurb.Bin070]